jgi:glycosyltransferase involved in cell wall biosynthesis
MLNIRLGILTDAAPSVNSSTSREVADLIDECQSQNVSVNVYHPALFPSDTYPRAQVQTSCTGFLYKNKRLPLRFLSEVLISIRLAVKILFDSRKNAKTDVVLWISPSIFNVLPAYVLKARNGTKIYLMLRDMFPHWAANIGIISRKGLIFNFFKMVADRQMNIADRIGVESSGALEFFKGIYPQHVHKVEILRNWIVVNERKIDKPENFADGIVKIIYAGNIGFAQGIDHFIGLLDFLKDRQDIEFHFVGRGDAVDEILTYVDSKRIKNFFRHEPIPFKDFDQFLVNFDIGLVFLNHHIRTSNVPGKAMSYLMTGLPVLGAINPENELESFVDTNQLGRLDSSGDVGHFLVKVDLMIADYRLGKYKASEIKKKSEIHFSATTALNQIVNLNGA